MTSDDLRTEIGIELAAMERLLKEILELSHDISDREPTVREKTAAATFMAQFYDGVENILKRISRFHRIPLPTGDTWHVDLFRRFCEPSYQKLPLLFDRELAIAMAAYRRFRHVVYHSYGFELEWDRMKEGISNVEKVFKLFKKNISEYVDDI